MYRLSAIFTALPFAFASGPLTPSYGNPASAPAHWWDFEAHTDDIVGDRTGTPGIALRPVGKYGNGYVLNGHSYIATDYAPSIAAGESFTVMFWARLPAGTVSSGGAFVWLERSGGQQISVSYGYPCDHSDAGAVLRDDGWDRHNIAHPTTCGTFVDDGTWRHYTLVLDRTTDTMRYYVGSDTDTQLVDETSTADLDAINVADPLTIYLGAGHRNDEAIVLMTGWLDEVKFFGNALTEAEVEEQMAAAPAVSPDHHWDFETGTDDVVGDRTGTPVNTMPPDGMFGSGYAFDGNTHLATNYAPSIAPGQSFTAMLWAKLPAGTINTGGAFAWLERSGKQQISVCYGYPCDHSDAGAVLRDDGWDRHNIVHPDTCGTFVDDGTWRHYALVLDRATNTMRYYVGSIVGAGFETQLVDEVDASDLDNINVADPLGIHFGAGNRNGDESIAPMTGWLDDVKFFESALTEELVECHAVSSCASPIPTASEWSILATTLLLLTVVTLVCMKHRAARLSG